MDVDDDELAALALAADPDTEVHADAVCLWDLPGAGSADGQLLPGWYMPAAVAGIGAHPWRRWVILLLVVSFLAIDAYGLCSTYGWIDHGIGGVR